VRSPSARPRARHATRTDEAADGTLENHAAAMEHLIETSRAHGVGVDVPEFLKILLDSGIRRGSGNEGIASVVEVLKQPAMPDGA